MNFFFSFAWKRIMNHAVNGNSLAAQLDRLAARRSTLAHYDPPDLFGNGERTVGLQQARSSALPYAVARTPTLDYRRSPFVRTFDK